MTFVKVRWLWIFFRKKIKCADNEQYSNSKVQRKITKQVQSEHGPL